MKESSIVFLISMISMGLFSQSNYEKAMQDALYKFENADSINELYVVASQFERISDVESTEWLPAYYSSEAYCYIVFRTEDPAKKESFVDQAQKMLNKAMEIASGESEIHTLQGMIYQAVIDIDPVNNGQIYSSKANGCFQKAIKINPENPRPYYLQALSLRYTPEQFGGGEKAALPLFENAMEKFNNFTPENDLYPNWGKKDCERNLKECKEDKTGI